MHFTNMRRLKSVLTNGEIEIDIICSKYDCGFNLPKGVVYSEDNNNMYLNNKPAHIELKEEED